MTDYQLLSETSKHAVARHAERLRWVDYEVLGEQYGSPYYANVGDTTRAKQSLERALLVAKDAYDQNPAGQNIYHLYYTYIGMAGVLCARGDLERALAYQSKGEALLESDAEAISSEPKENNPKFFSSVGRAMQDERAVAMIRRAYLLEQAGKSKKATRALQQSQSILERLFWADPRDSSVRRDLTRQYNLMGELLMRSGDLKGARRNYQDAIRINLDSLAAQPNQPEVRHRLADGYEGSCRVSLADREKQEALQNCETALELREALAKSDPNDARYAQSLARNYASIGDVFRQLPQRQNAIAAYQRALAIQGSLHDKDPFNALVSREAETTRRKLSTMRPAE
jgi:tetratricopeptide (TPR) repeat protein